MGFPTRPSFRLEGCPVKALRLGRGQLPLALNGFPHAPQLSVGGIVLVDTGPFGLSGCLVLSRLLLGAAPQAGRVRRNFFGSSASSSICIFFAWRRRVSGQWSC